MTIELLQENNLQSLKELYNNAFDGSTTHHNKMLDTYEKIKNNPNYIILCAIDNQQIVGSLMGVICYELFGNCKPFMVIENVAVLTEYRRKGIAKQLFSTLETIAIERDCSTILFVSSKHRTGAHKLYESLGFGADPVNGYRKRL